MVTAADWTRRDLLSWISSLGLSLILPPLSARAASHRGVERTKSLLTLWMGGGMSQLETWDPHPGLPAGGQVRDIATSARGIRISELLPGVAEQMHSAMLIRSLTSKEGDHERGTTYVKTGYRPEPTLRYPSLGAIAAHQLPDERVEIPQHVTLAPDQVFQHGGYLGNEWDAFRVFSPGGGLPNLESQLPRGRQGARLQGLEVLSRQFQQRNRFGEQQTLHQETIDRALKMMSSEQMRAFHLDDEPRSVVESYGDSHFGRGCLVARRLIEVGVRAVEVNLSGFDTHVANHEGHVRQCAILDPALAALIADLRDRDLLQSTIVLCISEFGRTPSINPASGRDHWPNWFSCLIAGGGFRSGAVIGATPGTIPETSAAAPADPVTIPVLYSTILRAMGIDPAREVMTPVGRPMRFSDAEPAEWLLAQRF